MAPELNRTSVDRQAASVGGMAGPLCSDWAHPLTHVVQLASRGAQSWQPKTTLHLILQKRKPTCPVKH